MTFFANSGITLPNLKDLTRQAAHEALGSASEIWRMISIIENKDDLKGSEFSRTEMNKCAEGLRKSAQLFSQVIKEVEGQGSVAPLTPSERELAAIAPESDYRYGRYGYDFDHERWSLANLYRELAKRLEILAA